MATADYENLDEICVRYSALYTGSLADVLDEMGLRSQVLPAEIQALAPGQRVAGRAMTVEGKATRSMDQDSCFVPILQMLGAIEAGDVIISQPHDGVCAHLGELSCEAAKYRGARGAIIDGGARDSDYILKLGFPVFCRYRTPLDVLGRWQLTSYGEPIKIGNVSILRGDFVVGDRDGVVVVPSGVALEVLARAEEVVQTENGVRKAILDGVHPVEAYRKYGRF